MEIAGLPLRSLISWHGRISRVQFLVCAFILMFAAGLLAMPLFIVVLLLELSFSIVMYAHMTLMVVIYVLFTSLTSRRAHDLGFSGWIPAGLLIVLAVPQMWLMLTSFPSTSTPFLTPTFLFPVLFAGNLIWLALMGYFLFVKGSAEPNRYGDPPNAIV